MRIRNTKDFLAGLMLSGIGFAALWIASDYRMGTAFRMGPGYFPVILSILLIVLGIITAVIALRSGEEVASPKLAWRPLFIVSIAVVLFGLFINNTGPLWLSVGRNGSSQHRDFCGLRCTLLLWVKCSNAIASYMVGLRRRYGSASKPCSWFLCCTHPK
jgi:hypothetical protein